MDATATGADEIGKAFQKVGGTAGALNIEFEKVSSWIAVISSKTRESAESIGNGVKSILARIQSLREKGFDEEDGTQISQVAKALNEVGIALLDDQGQFRNFGKVMDELGAKWSTLDNRQKAYLATTIAGTYQQSRFLNLMESYADSIKLYEQALNSAGTTQQKFNLWQQGTEAHLNKLRTASAGIWQTAFNSEEIRTAIDMLTSLTLGVQKLVKQFGLLPPVVGIVSTAFFLLNKNALKAVNAELVLMPARLASLQLSLRQVGIVATLTNGILNGLKLTLKTLWPVAVIEGIIFGIQKLSSYIVKTHQQQEVIKNQNEMLTTLAQKYFQLNEQLEEQKGTEQYTQTLNELKNVIEQIVEIAPNLANAWDKNGKAISIAEDQLENYNNTLKLTVKQQKQVMLGLAMKDEFAKEIMLRQAKIDYAKALHEANKKAKLYKEQGILPPGFVDNFINEAKVQLNIAERNYENAQSLRIKLEKELKELQEQLDKSSKQPDKPPKQPDKPPKQKELLHLDLTEAIIRQINAEVELSQQKSKILEQQIKLAEQQEDYNTAIKLTNEFLQNQQKIIINLQTANNNLHQEAEKIRQTYKQFDTFKWFTAEGEPTVEYIKEYNKASSEQQEIMEKVFNQLSKIKEAYMGNVETIQNLRFEIEKTNLSLKDLNKKVLDQYKSWSSTVEKIADEVIDIYKETYKKQKEIALDALEKEEKALEDEHKKKIEQLDEELDAYKKIINAKLKLIDQEEDEEDYNKKLTKLQKERQEILNKINILSLDDSIEARAKLTELNKELAKKDEEIEELKHDRTKELRKQNLQDQLEAYQQDIKTRETIENEKYENVKKRLQKEREETIRHYNNLINDERRFAAIRDEIIQNNLNNIKASFITFTEFIRSNLGIIGESISQNLIDRIEEAKKALANIDYATGANLQQNLIERMKANSAAWWSADAIERERLHRENQSIANVLGLTYNPETGAWYDKYGDRVYHEGGIVGGSSNRIIELINKLFNTKPNEQVVKMLKGELAIPQKNIFDNFLPNLRNLINIPIPVLAGVGSTTNNYELKVYVNNMVAENKKHVEEVFSTIVTGIQKFGRR